MNIKLISQIRYITNIIASYLPEGKFKKLLKKIYHRSRFHPFRVLKEIISKIELLEDNILFVELIMVQNFTGQARII